ncbi:MAG: DNA alkylation repair protein [Bacteroidales bacterium]|nr:DNA alkylation repair protein [Bacteroidales bacterium]MCF8403374.1 DNA alkylation repair protein [Bacteroidales bacterium]
MPDKLKDMFFTKESIQLFASIILKFYPDFNTKKFQGLIYDENWSTLELKARMRHTTTCLYQCLPKDYIESLVILIKAAPEVKGFEAMTLPDFVEVYGMDHWEESLNALGQFTRYYSSEFAIRPYLDKNPDLAIQYMLSWAESKHDNVRRFASEGCRPRLPWAMILPKFIANPLPVLTVLEKLKNDPSEFVRKSVANNLNDISKDHPDIAIETAERWYGNSPETNWIVKHGLRTLLKQGNIRAMRLFGFGDPAKIQIDDFKLSKEKLTIGEELKFSFELNSKESGAKNIRIEYIVDFVKANGKASQKVFQIIEKEYKPGRHKLERKHSFKNLSTRKHYPGLHKFKLIVNGEPKAEANVLVNK